MITTIVGNDSFEIDHQINLVKSKFIDNYGQLSISNFYLDDFDLVSLMDQITGTSLFNEKSLFVLSIIDINAEIIRFLELIIDRDNPLIEIILLLHKLDNKTVVAKTLKSKTNFLTYNLDNKFNINKWVEDYVSKHDGKIDFITTKFLIENVSKDKQRLSNELDKLILFNKTITVSSIKELCDLSLDSNIFNLISDVFNNRSKKAIDIYRSLRFQNEPSARILSTFTWALFNISILKLSKNPINTLAKETGINLNKLSAKQLQTITNNLLQIDLNSKSINNFDIDQAMELYFLEIEKLV